MVVALPATLGAKAAAQLLGALAPLRASAVAITHSDETNQLGLPWRRPAPSAWRPNICWIAVASAGV